MTTILNLAPNENHTVFVPLSDLISLRDTSFKLTEHTLRELDQEHVVALANTCVSEQPQWPPIEVVSTDEGLAVIDGYHRWKAVERNIWIKLLKLEELPPAKVTQAILAASELEEEKEHFNTVKAATMIQVHIGDYSSAKEVAKASLTANLKHGLPPKSQALVYIAMELYDVTRCEQPEPSQAEIARMVGISRATLNEYLKKREKLQVEATVDTQTQGDVEIHNEEDAKEKALKKAESLVRFLNKMYQEGEEEAANTAFRFLFESTVQSFMNEFYGHDQRELAEAIRSALHIAPDVLEKDLGGYVDFGQAFLQAMKLGKQSKTRKTLSKV